MTKLIALTLIAATACAELVADVAEGAAFEVSPEAAEPLLTAGLAALEAEPLTPPVKTKSVKARVLVGCFIGLPDDVVTLSSADAKAAQAEGLVDTNKDAVAYALTLAQPQA
jgi:hypothetical protein